MSVLAPIIVLILNTSYGSISPWQLLPDAQLLATFNPFRDHDVPTERLIKKPTSPSIIPNLCLQRD
jgi:hypothetical protein